MRLYREITMPVTAKAEMAAAVIKNVFLFSLFSWNFALFIRSITFIVFLLFF